MTPPVLRPLSAGEILDVSFSLFRRHFATLVGIALVSSGLPLLINIYVESSGGMLARPVLWVCYLFLAIVLSMVGTAATTFVVSESYLGRRLGAGEALIRSFPYVGRLFVYSLLFALAVGAGMLLLIVPGIILACGLILATPVVVLEAAPSAMAALNRSWELTKQWRLRIFGLMVAVALIIYIPMAAITVVLGIILGTSGATDAGSVTVWAMVFAGLAQIVLYPMFYTVLTVTYYDLRVRKEGFDLEVLASTLQPA